MLTDIEQPAPETEEEMMVEVFKYTERVVNMVRPRKLLFMAIGVCAPVRHSQHSDVPQMVWHPEQR